MTAEYFGFTAHDIDKYGKYDMNNKLNFTFTILSIVLNIVLSILIYNQYKIITEYKSSLPYSSIYNQYIYRSVEMWKIKSNESNKDIYESRFFKTMVIKNVVCVSIDLKKFGVGGVPVYCFDLSSGNMIYRDDDVE